MMFLYFPAFRYVYAYNNPLKYVDPRGMDAIGAAVGLTTTAIPPAGLYCLVTASNSSNSGGYIEGLNGDDWLYNIASGGKGERFSRKDL